MRKNGKKNFCLTLVLTLAMLLSSGAVTAFAATGSVTDKEGGYVGRGFDAEYDVMLDSLDGDALKGTATGDYAYIDDAYLSVTYDDSCKTDDAAVYKAATKTHSADANDSLVFEMAALSGTVTLDDFVIGLRKDDNTPVLNLGFDELFDGDGAALNTLTLSDDVTAPTIVEINFINSFDGVNFVDKDGAVVAPLSAGFVGFHLKAKEAKSGTVAFTDIYFTKGAVKNAIDNFEGRTAVDKGNPDTHWCGSETGFIQTRGLVLNDGASYLVADSAVNGKENVAVTMKKLGDDANVSLALVADAAAGADTAWADLDFFGVDAAPALTDSNVGYVMALGADKAVKGVKLTAHGSVFIQNIFFTDVKVKDTKDQPVFDPSDIVMFDDFNRDKTYAYGDYNQSVADPKTNQLGFSYILSYAGLAGIGIENGNLVFDAGKEGYMNYKAFAIDRVNAEKYDYVVFKVKAEGGATIGDFRFATGNKDDAWSTVKWMNGEVMANYGLPVGALGSAANKYVTNDGYTYVMAHLGATESFTRDVAGLELHFGGEGRLLIDEIFFANEQSPELDNATKNEFISFTAEKLAGCWWYNTNGENGYVSGGFADGITNTDDAILFTVTAENAYYQFNFASPGNNKDAAKRYMILSLKATGLNLSTVRIGFNGSADEDTFFYFKDGILGLDGKAIALDAVGEEYGDVIIDLEALGTASHEGFKLAIGGDGAEGTLSLRSISYADAKPLKYTYESALGGFDKTKPVVTLTVPDKATAGDEITVTASATDDVAKNLVPVITVTKDGKPVTHVNGKFTAEEGTYTVTATVSDGNGNTADTVTKTITVSAKQNKDDKGCSGCGSLMSGASAGPTALMIALAAAIGLAIVFSRKKTSDKK